MSESKLTEIKSRISCLIGEIHSDKEFLEWLKSYVQRAEQLLHPKENPVTERQRRDILRSYAQFQTVQKVVDWSADHKITLPKGEYWWWCNDDNRPAHINGLPNSRGLPRITNGLDVWIERFDGTLFMGHHDFLVWERKPRNNTKNGTSPKTQEELPKVTNRDREIASSLLLNGTEVFAEKYKTLMGQDLPQEALKSHELLAQHVHNYLETQLFKSF